MTGSGEQKRRVFSQIYSKEVPNHFDFLQSISIKSCDAKTTLALFNCILLNRVDKMGYFSELNFVVKNRTNAEVLV